jgi:LysR family transcriptional regulator, hydrogen peroxide-inducible genes activator
MVTLTQLEYVVAVDTYRHFVTAAEKCFVSQPTLSMQLKKLEDELNIVLFDRSKQPVVPTEIGEVYIRQARKVLGEANRLGELVAEHKGLVSGTLRIGVIPSVAPYLLPLFVGQFTRKYPQVSLQIHEMITEKIVEALQFDRIDAGILVTPLHETQIKESPLFYEGILLYTNAEHELGQKAEIHLSEIARPDIWLMSQGHCFRSQVINLCSYQSVQRQQLPFEYESGSMETLMRMVDKEGGFTLVPELLLQEMPEEKRDNIRFFTDAFPQREVSLVSSRTFAKERLLKLLKDEIRQSVPPEMLAATRGIVVEWK